MKQRNSLFGIIVKKISDMTALSGRKILGNRRYEPCVRARHMCAGMLWECGIGSTEIGRLLKRTRATALNSIRRHRDLYATDARYRKNFDELKAEVGRLWDA